MSEPAVDMYSLLLEMNSKMSKIEANVEQLKKDAQESHEEDMRIQTMVQEKIATLTSKQSDLQQQIDAIKNNKGKKLEYWFDKVLKYIIWGVTLWIISLIVNSLNLPIK